MKKSTILAIVASVLLEVHPMACALITRPLLIDHVVWNGAPLGDMTNRRELITVGPLTVASPCWAPLPVMLTVPSQLVSP